ncbi:MAG: crossover junction endodeoxyribonuclease RuvC [Planctomycetes bacterium]|nr:crossover junction endodeoxyribonuclease RuvC [Planctomycetota bacterium]
MQPIFRGNMATPRRILGIDPGLTITGYGVLEFSSARPILCEAGIIRTADDDATDLAEKVRSVYKGVAEVVAQFKPEAMAVEQLYAHYDHPRTAILMGHARGVIFLAAAEQGIPVVSYASTQVKKIVTGNGRASKEQVQRTIQRELGLATMPEPPDVADALAVALCHYYTNRTL